MLDGLIQQVLDDKLASWTKLLADKAGFTPEQAQKFVPATLEKVGAIVKQGTADAAGLDAEKVMQQLDAPDLAKRAGVDTAKATAGLKALLPEIGKVLKSMPQAKGFFESTKGLFGQIGQQISGKPQG